MDANRTKRTSVAGSSEPWAKLSGKVLRAADKEVRKLGAGRVLPEFRKQWREIASSLNTLDLTLGSLSASTCGHSAKRGEACVRCIEEAPAKGIIECEESIVRGLLRLSVLAEHLAPSLPVGTGDRSAIAAEAGEALRGIAFGRRQMPLMGEYSVSTSAARGIGDLLDGAVGELRAAGLIVGWRVSSIDFDSFTRELLAADAESLSRWKALSGPDRMDLLQRAMPSVIDVLTFAASGGGCDEPIENSPVEFGIIVTRLGIDRDALLEYARYLRCPPPFDVPEHRPTAQAVVALDIEPARTSFYRALCDGYSADANGRVIGALFRRADQVADVPKVASVPESSLPLSAPARASESQEPKRTADADRKPGVDPLIVTARFLNANVNLKPDTLAKGAKSKRWPVYKRGHYNTYHLDDLIAGLLDPDDQAAVRELRSRLLPTTTD